MKTNVGSVSLGWWSSICLESAEQLWIDAHRGAGRLLAQHRGREEKKSLTTR